MPEPQNQAMASMATQKAIAQSHYGGTSDGNPCGITSTVSANAGYGLAYKDWPQSLKDEYSYNPTKAKQLLKDAGYPSGFKTTMVYNSAVARHKLYLSASGFTLPGT
jgi:ABC-type transport system substrate-binding protein